jgi:hypothetical protein
MHFARLTNPQKISVISMLVVAVGAFLPWVSLLGINAYGIQGDGAITLILAVAGIVLLGLNDTTNFAAIGIYLTLLGGIAWIVGAGWQLGLRTRPAEATTTSSAESGQPG